MIIVYAVAILFFLWSSKALTFASLARDPLMFRAAVLQTVTASEVAEAFAGEGELPPNAVMISFDDGRSDAMMFADPMLREAGMRATMFVITDSASEPGTYYESWDGPRTYAASGRWDIQSHSAGSHYEQDVPGNGPSPPALTSLGYDEGIGEYTDRVRSDLEPGRGRSSRTGSLPGCVRLPVRGSWVGLR